MEGAKDSPGRFDSGVVAGVTFYRVRALSFSQNDGRSPDFQRSPERGPHFLRGPPKNPGEGSCCGGDFYGGLFAHGVWLPRVVPEQWVSRRPPRRTESTPPTSR